MTFDGWPRPPSWFGAPHPYRFRALFAALLLLLAAVPLTVKDPLSDPLFAFALSLVILVGVLAMRSERKLLLLALLLGVPAVLVRWIAILAPEQTPVAFGVLFPLFFFLFFVLFLLRAVITAERITEDTLVGALSVYLLLGIVWSLIYEWLLLIDPGSFRVSADLLASGALDRMDLLYYSFITLATVGYGDITPVMPLAQSFAYAEAVTGVLYVAVLVARLVSAYRR